MTAPLQTEGKADEVNQQRTNGSPMISTEALRISERHAEVVLKRFTKSLGPWVVNDHLICSRRSMEAIWQLMGRKSDYELRQAWVTASGWDQGWIFQNWKQLPEKLQYDLCALGVKGLFKLLRESMEKTKKELGFTK